MSKIIFALIIIFAESSMAQSQSRELNTLSRLGTLTQTLCLSTYNLDSRSPQFIDQLKAASVSEVDKFACAYPLVLAQIKTRLADLQKLDPQSAWGQKAYVTLAARIYNFDYLDDTPHGTQTLEIIGIHPDLMILHRILRQITPYALALVYPRLGPGDAGLPMQARLAAAGAAELTPWSALLHQAKGVDCYGPKKDQCLSFRTTAIRTLKQALIELKKDENLFGFLSQYSSTSEATGLAAAPSIEIATLIRKSLSGESVDSILGVQTGLGWMNIRPDLRDTLDYLAAHNQDLSTPTDTPVYLKNLDCKVVYRSLFALANEDESNTVRQAMAKFNPAEALLKSSAKPKNDAAALIQFLDSSDCQNLGPLQQDLSFNGLLSRFQAYQAHIFLLTGYSSGVINDAAAKLAAKQFALFSDIENVINEIQKLPADSSPVIATPTEINSAKELIDFARNILKET